MIRRHTVEIIFTEDVIYESFWLGNRARHRYRKWVRSMRLDPTIVEIKLYSEKLKWVKDIEIDVSKSR